VHRVDWLVRQLVALSARCGNTSDIALNQCANMRNLVRESLPQLALTAVLVVLASVMGLGWGWVLVCGMIGLVGGSLRRKAGGNAR
jgi:hypothetical protein